MNLKSFSIPLIFLGALVFSMFFESILPYAVKSLLYAASLTIKEILIFFLPFVIFSLVFSSISRLGAKALKYILIILPLICLSNFVNTVLSYVSTNLFLNGDLSVDLSEHSSAELLPAFSLTIPHLLSNDITLLLGVVSGLVTGIYKPDLASRISQIFGRFTSCFFRLLLPIMPLFIVGTTLKLQSDGILSAIFEKYLPVLFVFVVSSFGLVFTEFLILARFRMSEVTRYLKNIAPAVITAFGAMSSAAALPLSIKAAEQNVRDPNNAGVIVPSTVNIHLVGDCFFIPMIALVAMMSFGVSMPLFGTYIVFAVHFMLAKFAVAAIPGGGVLVMLPIMQTYLGLNTDMLALVTALYILFDPIITTCNVAGNGAMAIIFDRITGLGKR